jgi:hypothetical protein
MEFFEKIKSQNAEIEFYFIFFHQLKLKVTIQK